MLKPGKACVALSFFLSSRDQKLGIILQDNVQRSRNITIRNSEAYVIEDSFKTRALFMIKKRSSFISNSSIL